jgi:hypothetical protein
MHTVTVEVTPRERADLARALRALADEEAADERPGEADRLRGLAGRIERG